MPIQKITKEEIIQRSINVFRSQGYHRTSMADLAMACGLTKGLFYHYFDSKESLMKAALQSVHGYFKEKILDIAYWPDMAPEEKLALLLDKIFKVFSRSEGGCFIANTTLETSGIIPEFEQSLRAFFQDWLDAFTHLLESKYAPSEARKLAKLAVGDIEGAVLLMRLFNDPEYLRMALDRTARLL